MELINFHSDENGVEVNPKMHLLVETNELTADNRKKRSRCTRSYSSLAKKNAQLLLKKRQDLYQQIKILCVSNR